MKRKKTAAFLLGLAYSIFGLFGALLLYPENPTFVALTFITILLIPSLEKLLSEGEEEKYDFTKLWRIHTKRKHIFRIFIFIFLGIVVAFAFFSVVMPESSVSHLFKNQLDILKYSSTDYVGSGFGNITSILFNNLSVLLVCCIVSFIYGIGGSLFVLIWNASVFGTIFGFVARHGAGALHITPVTYLIIILIAVLPHMILEVLGYFMGGVGGKLLSDYIVQKKLTKKTLSTKVITFFTLFLSAVVLIFISSYIEGYFAPFIIRYMVGI